MKSLLYSLALLVGISQAVHVAPQHAGNGGCAGAAQDIDIGNGVLINLSIPENCVFNTNKDPNFNMNVCTGTNLQGQCIELSSIPNRVEIDGFFNWQIPFNFLSMQRTGN
jgi:hypothetical protein